MGDNNSDWDHFSKTIGILLQDSISGIHFMGPDVPGYWNDPTDDELVVRSYQLGAFLPLYRANADHFCKRREPWVFSD